MAIVNRCETCGKTWSRTSTETAAMAERHAPTCLDEQWLAQAFAADAVAQKKE